MTINETISPDPDKEPSASPESTATESLAENTSNSPSPTATVAAADSVTNDQPQINLAETPPLAESAGHTEMVVDEATIQESAATPSVEELTRQLIEATAKADNYWETLLRKQAEYENLQKRMTRDVDNARKYALEKFATELLSVKDSMELGLEAASKPETELNTVRDGMALTLKMLTDIMNKFNLVEINPQNQKFDPQWHEAMAMQPVPNVAEGTILHVHQKGYQLNERLLRPARVIVAKAIETEKPLENQG